MVRLGLSSCGWVRPPGPRFNPTMVRLGRIRPVVGGQIEIGFNPTMVRLGHQQIRDNLTYLKGFNPTMVRLGQDVTLGRSLTVSLFQSHYGAIRTGEVVFRFQQYELRFNPTMVRLGPVAEKILAGVETRFNPTMVRLGLSLPAQVREDLRSFNPTMVRLGRSVFPSALMI